jgi:hypothetical protein
MEERTCGSLGVTVSKGRIVLPLESPRSDSHGATAAHPRPPAGPAATGDDAATTTIERGSRSRTGTPAGRLVDRSRVAAPSPPPPMLTTASTPHNAFVRRRRHASRHSCSRWADAVRRGDLDRSAAPRGIPRRETRVECRQRAAGRRARTGAAVASRAARRRRPLPGLAARSGRSTKSRSAAANGQGAQATQVRVLLPLSGVSRAQEEKSRVCADRASPQPSVPWRWPATDRVDGWQGSWFKSRRRDPSVKLTCLRIRTVASSGRPGGHHLLGSIPGRSQRAAAELLEPEYWRSSGRSTRPRQRAVGNPTLRLLGETP